jgi:glycosyltransferase involved in cell wall biosynthesis
MNRNGDNPPRARLLLAAFSCRPGLGSEPGVGWNRAVQAAERFDCWVLCDEEMNQEAIRRYLAQHGPLAGLEFVFVPSGRCERWLRRLPGVCFAAYNLWQRRAFRVAQKLHAELQFDLVHQVNLCTFREPGYLWKLDLPFVWGPFGGTQNYPWRFLAEAGLWGALSEGSRNVANRLQLRFNRRIRRAASRATALLAANTTNQRDFSRACQRIPLLMCDVGATDRPPAASRTRDPSAPLRILWAGDLRPCKALSLLLKALAQLPVEVRYEVRVVGKGSLQGRWQRLARRLGVHTHVTWMGSLPHDETLRQYDWADLFAFTSLRDTTGTVVLEALSAGVPVLCLDHQGVHDVVNEKCGIKVPVTSPRESVARLADAIAALAGDRDRLELLSHGARQRAVQCSWSHQGEAMAAVYQRALDVAARSATEPSPLGQRTFLASPTKNIGRPVRAVL